MILSGQEIRFPQQIFLDFRPEYFYNNRTRLRIEVFGEKVLH